MADIPKWEDTTEVSSVVDDKNDDSIPTWDNTVDLAPKEDNLATMASLVDPKQPMSKTGSALAGATQTATAGFADELTGAYGTVLKNMGVDLDKNDLATFLKRAALSTPMGIGLGTGLTALKATKEEIDGTQNGGFEELMNQYRQSRDLSRAGFKQAQEDNPWSYGGGALAGGIATSFLPGAGVLNTIKGAAALGGATALGTSDVDLTQDINQEKLKDLAGDVALGTALGGGFAAGGKLIGKGIDLARKSELGQTYSRAKKVGERGLRLGGAEGQSNWENYAKQQLKSLITPFKDLDESLRNVYNTVEQSKDVTEIPFEQLYKQLDEFYHPDPKIMDQAKQLRALLSNTQEKYATPLMSQVNFREEIIPGTSSNEEELLKKLQDEANFKVQKEIDKGTQARSIVEKTKVGDEDYVRQDILKYFPEEKMDTKYAKITPGIPESKAINIERGPTIFDEKVPIGPVAKLQKTISGVESKTDELSGLKSNILGTLEEKLPASLKQADEQSAKLKTLMERLGLKNIEKLDTPEGQKEQIEILKQLIRLSGEGPDSVYNAELLQMLEGMGGDFAKLSKELPEFFDVVKVAKDIKTKGLNTPNPMSPKSMVLTGLGSSITGQTANFGNLVGKFKHWMTQNPQSKTTKFNKLYKNLKGGEQSGFASIPSRIAPTYETTRAEDINSASNLYNYDNNQLMQVGSKLRNAGFGDKADALQKAIESGDQNKKNAILFTIKQNPDTNRISQEEFE